MSGTRGKDRHLLPTMCLVVTLLVVGTVAAESYFRVAPGPLSAAHAAYDNSESCATCHVSSKGVTNGQCLTCHASVTRGRLHRSFGGRACIACHTEHKGRSYGIIDWSSVGGRDTFNHGQKTGFELREYHAQVACKKCHVARLSTGSTSYLGLPSKCGGCHKGVHGFTKAELSSNCNVCHTPGKALRGQRLSNWSGQHQRYSGLDLVGRHRDQLCTRCHDGGKMPGNPVRQCYSCHAPPHPVTPATVRCTNCHSQNAPMKRASIDHSDFGFPLAGRHAKVGCQSCHGRGKGTPVSVTQSRQTRRCVDCHAATHPVTRATANCGRCHSSGGTWRGAKIDHARFGLGLWGKHRNLRCGKCHTKGQRTLEYSEGACTTCHTHENAHDNQFADKPCATCHVEGGKRTKPFDHDLDTQFPLFGLHGANEVRNNCSLCHPNKIYRTGKLACADCHEDYHKGEFGTDCRKCHSPMVKFSSPRTYKFDHSSWPLEGKHKTIPCKACHENAQYKLEKHECIDCHAKDDPHQGSLGKDCGRCHRPEKGAPKFRHDSMTGFPLKGAHRGVDCALCHQPRSRTTGALSVTEWKKAEAPKLDRRFPVRGRKCSQCHTDPHHGYMGDDCDVCHSATNFYELTGPRARAILPGSHRGSWLRRHTWLPFSERDLRGNELNCSTCHGTPACRNCHRTQKPRSHTGLWRLKTHGFSAEFNPSSCSVCHQRSACTGCHRRTAPLNHRGAWRTVHGYAAGGFGASNCYVCHQRLDCLACHRSP